MNDSKQQAAPVASPAPAGSGRGRQISVFACIWLGATLIAGFLALVHLDSAYIDGEYIPRGNDSLYHARRILDAAFGDRGFYEFDERLQVPDGAWIPWPWAYDYLLAKATQAAVWLNASMDPLAFLAYVPVAWIAVNAALFLGAATALGLSVDMRIAAMLAFALSPLTQLLHTVGMLDHHFIEHSFVLLAILLGLRWFAAPKEARPAALLGSALGIATAFHNGLFILQIPVLICLSMLWLRSGEPAAKPLRIFAACLLGAALLSALPSQALRNGMFEFALLSWFHVYVAACTAATVGFISLGRFSKRRGAIFVGLALLLAAPIIAQLLQGANFLSGSFSVLDEIVEARSPFRMFTETMGPMETASHYSWLLLLAPAFLLYYAYRLIDEENGAPLYYAVWVVFGLTLLLTQFRFYYFGLFTLITAGLIPLDRIAKRQRWPHGGVFAGALAIILVLYQPALRQRLFIVYAPGADLSYAGTRPLYFELAELCANDPGIVLANHDDGNALLFHTDCLVIANNFIMRPEDEAKITEIDHLMRSTPQSLRRQFPPIDYVLLRARDFSVLRNGEEVILGTNQIAQQLLIDDSPPEGFELIRTVFRDAERENVYARLFRVHPSGDRRGGEPR